MHLQFSPDHLAFQQDVRDFLDEYLTEDLREAQRKTPSVWVEKEISTRWHRILNDKGWLAYFWPEEYGGPGWDSTQRYIFNQECAKADAPTLIPMGLRYAGPVIFTFGSDWQKDYFLPRILNCEHYWCQGYSEPGAGSDLAALKCKAVRDGDDYIINGTKIWTTDAHIADWIFVLVRTGEGEKKQQGISFILVDMKSKGIKVDPILTLAGDHEVNQVFFDDVRVPAKNLVGQEGQGWDYAKFLLGYERGGAASGKLMRKVEDLKNLAAKQMDGQGNPLIRDRAFADELAKMEIEIMGLEMTELRTQSALAAGQAPGPEGSVTKNIGVAINQRLDELALEALHYYATSLKFVRPLYATNEWLPGSDEAAMAMPSYLNNRAASIYGGSNEVQRDIIAKQVLGL